MRAGREAGPAVVAAVGLQVGDFARVDLDDRLCPAGFDCRAAFAGLAEIGINMQKHASEYSHPFYFTHDRGSIL